MSFYGDFCHFAAVFAPLPPPAPLTKTTYDVLDNREVYACFIFNNIFLVCRKAKNTVEMPTFTSTPIKEAPPQVNSWYKEASPPVIAGIKRRHFRQTADITRHHIR